ncbi:MAG: dimethyl sulfoxide reductase anchor subunit [Sulfuricellaceae bacterium]|nr:dimethyl sulfoxide reductase anchor subunit [Sulfuricellaceae bacterium]
MNPAFSVVFLTTLIGVGQGLFLALYTGEVYALFKVLPAQDSQYFYAQGSLIALVFLALGLLASFFHLGHPERAWRAAARWRTSWLSREVIVLPAFMGTVFLYGLAHYFGWNAPAIAVSENLTLNLTVLIGLVGTVLCFALFICTGMIYACLKFLQEWHSPLTIVNFVLLGGASGFTFATAFSMAAAPGLVNFFGLWAIAITMLALLSRSASLIRNARLKSKSTLQTAIGVRHTKVVQKSMGFMGGSFNTREFFHGLAPKLLRALKWIFLLLVFPLPVLFLTLGLGQASFVSLLLAFAFQYGGLLIERWFFFAQANHPQNLYYQTVG